MKPVVNSNKDNWKSAQEILPDLGETVFILIEHRMIVDEDEQKPFVRQAKLVYREYAIRWQLTIFDEGSEPDIIGEEFAVILWRYLG